MPWYSAGYDADYPDPANTVPLLVGTDNLFCGPDACNEVLNSSTYRNAACEPSNALGYWSKASVTSGIPDNCQGNAWEAMQIMINMAAGLPANSQRILWYNMIDNIAYGLGLYVYWEQEAGVTTFASWIDPSTVNTNTTIGGSLAQPWYNIGWNAWSGAP